MRTKLFAAGCAAVLIAAMSGCAAADNADSAFSAAGTASSEAPAVTETTAVTESAPAAETVSVPEDISSGDDSSSVDENAELIRLAEDRALSSFELDDPAVKRLAAAETDPAGYKPLPSSTLFDLRNGGRVETETVPAGELYNSLARAEMSGNAPDIFPTDSMDMFPKGAAAGLFSSIEGLIDFNSELWSDTDARSGFFTFRGERCGAVIEAVPRYVCIYDRKTVRDNSLNDPAELYSQGEWTYGWFEKLCTDFSDISDGKYALDGYDYQNALSETCGVPLLTMENGMLLPGLEDTRLAAVQNWMYSLAQQGVCFDQSANNWRPRTDGLTDGKTLFWPADLSLLTGAPEQLAKFGDTSAGEVMFLPMPRDEKQYMSASLRGYLLCSGAGNPEGAAEYLNCLKAAREKDNEAEEQRLAEQLGWTDEMLEMRRECYKLAETAPVLDCSKGMPEDTYENLFKDALSYSMYGSGYGGEWSDTVAELSKQINYAVTTFNDPHPLGP